MNVNVVKNVGLRDWEIKLVTCTPRAVDGFPNTTPSFRIPRPPLYFRISGTFIQKGEVGPHAHAEDDLCLSPRVAPFSSSQHHDHTEC